MHYYKSKNFYCRNFIEKKYHYFFSRFSSTPIDGQIGLRMTCMIDGFLTDLKVRTLDRNFCQGCIFIAKEGPARRLERIIRTIMHYIYAVAQPSVGPDGVHQSIRNFTYEQQQLFIKRIWIDRLYDEYELKEDTVSCRRNGVDVQMRVNDLSYDPNNHDEQMLPRLSMFRFVIENLQPVSWYFADISCRCGVMPRKPFQVMRFMATRITTGVHISVEAAYFTFNPMSLEFDDEYWEYGAEDDSFYTSNFTRNLSKKVDGKACDTCQDPIHLSNFGTPETTWLLVVECPNVYKYKLKHTQLPPSVIFQGELFELAWVSYMKDGNHYISVHRMGGFWYFYDDYGQRRGSQPCPFSRLDSVQFNRDRVFYTLERAFYLRTPVKTPHRCLVLAEANEHQ